MTFITDPQHVYFLEWPEVGLIKIGCSRRPFDRLCMLRSQGWKATRFLALTRGSFRRERYLHRKFQAHRVWGEWYSAVEEIRAFASKIGVKRFVPDKYTAPRLHYPRIANALGLERVVTYRKRNGKAA